MSPSPPVVGVSPTTCGAGSYDRVELDQAFHTNAQRLNASVNFIDTRPTFGANNVGGENLDA